MLRIERQKESDSSVVHFLLLYITQLSQAGKYCAGMSLHPSSPFALGLLSPLHGPRGTGTVEIEEMIPQGRIVNGIIME
jgi:hypothetical protein